MLKTTLRQITSIDKQVKPLLDLQKELRKQRESLLGQIKAKEAPTTSGIPGLNGTDNTRLALNGTGNGTKVRSNTTDYMGGFEWTREVKSTLRSVWGIRSFRLCQEGVINACMDGREYVSRRTHHSGRGSFLFQCRLRHAHRRREITLLPTPSTLVPRHDDRHLPPHLAHA
jgi:hypothetical protein